MRTLAAVLARREKAKVPVATQKQVLESQPAPYPISLKRPPPCPSRVISRDLRRQALALAAAGGEAQEEVVHVQNAKV